MVDAHPQTMNASQAIVARQIGGALAIALATIVIGQAFAPGSLLVVAAMVALAALNGKLVAPRLDRSAICGLSLLVLGVLWQGIPGAMGAAFTWLMVDSIRSVFAQSVRVGQMEPGGYGRNLLRLHLILLPVFAFSLVAAAAPHVLLGLPLDLPHPPVVAVIALGLMTILACAEVLLRGLTRWRLGEPRWLAAAHDMSWLVLILVAFILASDISAGVMGLIAFRLAFLADLRLPAPREVREAIEGLKPQPTLQPSFTAVP
ncbi:MAG: hypothetical protein ACOYKM_05170 [Caulobacterales bacterium]|jgi:hypothetical protein